jgi:YfiH family protein
MTASGMLVPAWPAPANVRAVFTTRSGGVSAGHWDDAHARGGLNLGANCGDEPQQVALNRSRLGRQVGVPISWLEQVHGARVHELAAPHGKGCATAQAEVADAQVTTATGIALGVLVADCLPVLLTDRAGSIVGVAHAGWRGLSAGVLENTLGLMRARRPAAEIIAWLGPCIGPSAFEVGADVVAAFTSQDPRAASHFAPGANNGKWLADLAGLAAQRLQRLGVAAIARCGACTVSDSERFWSYRRDGACGRMAGLIWLHPGDPPAGRGAG